MSHGVQQRVVVDLPHAVAILMLHGEVGEKSRQEGEGDANDLRQRKSHVEEIQEKARSVAFWVRHLR